MPFPSPIGGISYPIDFGPSITFAVAYGCLLPLVAYRFFDKDSRTVLLIGSSCFAIERIVAFSLRAMESRNASKRFSLGLIAYFQADLALGYISIAADLGNLLRTLLVIATYGSNTYIQSTEAQSRYRFWLSTAKLAGAEGGSPTLGARRREFPQKPPEGTPDDPQTRLRVRRGAGALGLAFLPATATGIAAAVAYKSVVRGEIDTHQNIVLRYASSAVALFVTSWIVCASAWAYFSLRRVNRQGCLIACTISSLMCIIAIYRLCVMHYTTESLQSIAPGSLNGVGDKAAFYIFHVLPEWLSLFLLFTCPTRRIFSTGLVGDWRWRDETPEELQKRLRKEATHRERLQLRNFKDLELEIRK